MSVDAIRDAVDRAYPAFPGRSGDWPGIIGSARPVGLTPRGWLLPAVAAVIAAMALVLFWPGGGKADRHVLERALAAVDGGPVIHLVVQTRTVEFYELATGRVHREPIVNEIWFDARRGTHNVVRVDGRVVDDVLVPPGQTELDRQYLGLGAAYRKALRDGSASVGETEQVEGRRVYWISFEIRYPVVGIPTHVAEHSVAIDAQTYEPIAWRQGSQTRSITLWETLPVGRGDFTAARTLDGTTSERWYGISRVGVVTPHRAAEIVRGAVWLGRTYGDLPLASIREVRYESGRPSQPLEPDEQLPGLEVCYGAGKSCALLISQTTQPHPMVGRFASDVTPEAGSMVFAPDDRHALLVRPDGLLVTLEAEGRDALVSAALAIAPIR